MPSHRTLATLGPAFAQSRVVGMPLDPPCALNKTVDEQHWTAECF
jgi:hypothetical protein